MSAQEDAAQRAAVEEELIKSLKVCINLAYHNDINFNYVITQASKQVAQEQAVHSTRGMTCH